MWDEPFTYANSNLVGHGGWQFGPDAVSLQVVSNAVKRPSSSGTGQAQHAYALLPCDLTQDFEVTFTIDVPIAPSENVYTKIQIGDDEAFVFFQVDFEPTLLGPNVCGVQWATAEDGNGLDGAACTFNAQHTFTLRKQAGRMIVLIDSVEVLNNTTDSGNSPGSALVDLQQEAATFATCPTLTRLVVTGTE